MASGIEGADKRALLNIIFKEFASTVRSPVYDYLKTGLLSPTPDLLGALSCITQDDHEDELPVALSQDKCEVLWNSRDEDFYQIFKFKKQTMKDLIQLMETRLQISDNDDGTPVTVKKKVLVTCWLITSAEEYCAASDVFSISVSTVIHSFFEVCVELTKLAGQLVKWPSETELISVIDAFEMKYGFPGIVGVIGSTSFYINHLFSMKDHSHFYNPESDQHSIVIQAVCDHQMIFRDICVGVPSRRTPSEILRDSPLYVSLVSRTAPLMKPRTFILGNRDYPQLANLLTPYSPEARHRPLDETEKNFNKQHSVVESLIHKCFEMLRTRFLKLNCINIFDTAKATHIVLAACVLHNFAVMRGDVFCEYHQSLSKYHAETP